MVNFSGIGFVRLPHIKRTHAEVAIQLASGAKQSLEFQVRAPRPLFCDKLMHQFYKRCQLLGNSDMQIFVHIAAED